MKKQKMSPIEIITVADDSPIMRKITSFNDMIVEAVAKVRALSIVAACEGRNRREVFMASDSQRWKHEVRPAVSAAMALLNAQAKYEFGLGIIAGNGLEYVVMFDYGKIISASDALLLYDFEFVNFTGFMGKSVLDWAAGGEGLFFSLYYDVDREACELPKVARFEETLHGRMKERIVRWNEMYPALAPGRPLFEKELDAFLAAAEAVENKDAAYRQVPQEAWTALTARLKELTGAMDVDSISFDALVWIFGVDANLEKDVDILDDFYGRVFFRARSCVALRVDMKADRRLGSIARVIAVARMLVPCACRVVLSEWLLEFAYGSGEAVSKLADEVRTIIVTSSAEVLIRRWSEASAHN